MNARVIGTVFVLVAVSVASAGMVETTLCPDDAAHGDRFGYAVALSGDVLVTGSEGDDSAGWGSGAAYVFARSGMAWTQEAKLVASDGSEHDHFGAAVDVDGDRVVVGAHGEDTGALNAGAVYVFRRDPGGWVQEAKLVPDDPTADTGFGWSVGIDGDSIVVGSIVRVGRAYVFRYDGGTWFQEARLQSGGGRFGDFFGYAVAIDGDTVVVGAFGYDGGGSLGPGSAFVYRRNGGAWDREARLDAAGGSPQAAFGYSVSVSGDTVAVGAYGDDTLGTDSGCVHVFTREDSGWTPQARLVPPAGRLFDNFGYSVAVSGDTIVGGGDPWLGGYAQVFHRDGEQWIADDCLAASDCETGDWFGHSVAVDQLSVPNMRRMDGGPMTIDMFAMGSPYHAGNGEGYCGAVYVYFDTGPGLSP